MKLKTIGALILKAADRFGADNAPRLAAALAFYTMISMTPLLLVVVGVAGQVFGEEAARGELVEQIEGTIGREAAVLVEGALRDTEAMGGGLTAALLGLAALLIGATTVFANLKAALNTIWEVEAKPNERGFLWAVRGFLLTRVVVFVVVLGVGFLLLASLLATTGIEAAATYFDERLPLPPGMLRVINTLVSLGLVTVLFAYIYRAVPDVRIEWSDVWFGAFVTAVLFTIGKHLIGLYLGSGTVGTAYGAAGALVVLLVWVYYSAMIFFFGAELTQVYASRFGSQWRARRGFRFGQRRAGADAGRSPSEESG